ncbi:MAG TPA: gamma-glutamylcyclotransferase family protein [Thermoanaerobaculia bacterium]
MPLLFVYATLRRGESHHALVVDRPFVGEGTTRGALRRLGPYTVLCAGEDVIRGEVYDVDDFDALDRYEGDEYARQVIDVDVNGQTLRTFAYVRAPLSR